jgi:hypothetical protein
MGWLKRQLKGLKTASQAGAIVGRCKTGCRADDATHTIIPCLIHEAEIARLATENEACYKK